MADLNAVDRISCRCPAVKPERSPTATSVRRVGVIGCGNSNRSDDGVGPAVIRALAMSPVATDVLLLDAGNDGMAVMFAARGCETLVIVDACRSGAPAGAIFEVPGAALERRPRPSITMHDFRWSDALHAGRMMFQAAFPADVTVFLIEAKSLEYGLELSDEVAASVVAVAQRIDKLIATQRGRRAS